MTDRVDRSASAVVSSHDDAADAERHYWWSRTPEERRRAVQLFRQRTYGEAASGRLQRVLEITRHDWPHCA